MFRGSLKIRLVAKRMILFPTEFAKRLKYDLAFILAVSYNPRLTGVSRQNPQEMGFFYVLV